METLVVATHHRNHHQYYGRNRRHNSSKFDSFGSASSDNFRGISCPAFQSGEGLLPTPMRSYSHSNSLSTPLSPKTPSPTFSENRKDWKPNAKTSLVAIPFKIKFEDVGKIHFSERWAGPAYSVSPPPSSLPLPKFSLHPKRTVSLDLPTFASEINMRPIAKSAPASPTRGRSPSPIDLYEYDPSSPSYPRDTFDPPSFGHLLDRTDSATKTLCRILNLDITDE
ncbi:hypothetical protein SASPL_120938 [Salvia splendens]|uniref:Uncharacterized protein n=1 Tax=Salvia splendens TaxID=180675 RepID=A0A8X8XTZ7_SALSN|nr:uncharacterized protein LOC121742284 [Salvia splendens]KAG6418734.1 hypothetical protein SASPL_120938 [Salvia splendens]